MKFTLLSNKIVVPICWPIRKVTLCSEAPASGPNPQPQDSTLNPPIILLLDLFQYHLS